MIPAVRQRVRVSGLDGVFLVVQVDHNSQCAILNLLGGPPEAITVPFELLEPEQLRPGDSQWRSFTGKPN